MGPNDYLDTLRPLAMRFGLERMERALDALGRPDRDLAILHVAGTNGKGSTCAMAARALRLAGHRVGLYTSPHLVRFHERIQVDGRAIDDAALAARIEEVRSACPWHERGERGRSAHLLRVRHAGRAPPPGARAGRRRGGRGRARRPLRRHQRGDAAGRGGGPHRARPHAVPGGPGRRHRAGEGRHLQARRAGRGGLAPSPRRRWRPCGTRRGGGARRSTSRRPSWDGPIALRGAHQEGNAALAAAALRLLDAAGVRVGEEEIRAGIASARWPGRMEEVGGVLLDGAHNPDGAAALAAALPVLHPSRPVELVFGVLSDKDHEGMLAALAPAARRIHLVAPDSPRARDAGSYVPAARRLGAAVDVHASLPEALACARAAARDGALVCVAGSLYLVGEARRRLAGEEM